MRRFDTHKHTVVCHRTYIYKYLYLCAHVRTQLMAGMCSLRGPAPIAQHVALYKHCSAALGDAPNPRDFKAQGWEHASPNKQMWISTARATSDFCGAACREARDAWAGGNFEESCAISRRAVQFSGTTPIVRRHTIKMLDNFAEWITSSSGWVSGG